MGIIESTISSIFFSCKDFLKFLSYKNKSTGEEMNNPEIANSEDMEKFLFLPTAIGIWGSTCKRLFDIFFSAGALTIGLPIFIGLAIAIKLTSKGNILYVQERIGKEGKTFKFYKFRTMYQGADKKINEILLANPDLMAEWQISQKLKNDPRITPIGLFLRQTSLDELPQFWNVLIGNLSLVGPRPYLPEQVQEHLGRKAEKILSVRPGLTGIWQTSGRSHTTFTQRIQMEEQYIDQISFKHDLKLILKTVPCMIFRKGAY
jgi:undecaprenyl-phosphate galactose phosphotransferase